jgi:molecular chaperone DnaK
LFANIEENEMASRGVMAIDFGTANTYFCKCPDDQVSPKGVDFDGKNAGLDTAILHREGKEPLIGHTAFEEFGEATADERRSYRFRAQFKPDIATSAEARNDAAAFLKAVLDNARKKFLDIEPADRRVIFGVPAEADRTFRETLAEIALTAGYGKIETREEPIGGLFYHVSDKTIAPRDALRGVLVIDFGGGTCDLTFTFRSKIKKSWGDMHLGGRVIDDLFYQWLMEQNPTIAGTLDPRNQLFVFYLCRELKEGFSRKMKDDRNATFSRTVREYGRLSDATWQAFVDRCSRYRPSAMFAQHLHTMGAVSTIVDKDEPTDLIGWFRDSPTGKLTSEISQQ